MDIGSMADPASHRLPLRIALTGGIASGKSAAASRFAELGVPVIDTDQLARSVVEPGQPTLQKITARFGSDALDANGRLDRGRMRQRIFENEAERRALEAILHPAIRAEQERLAAVLGGAYQIHVVPLLVETHAVDRYDRVLLVDCSAETQLQRLLLRDGITPELARRMLAAQASREQRLSVANDVLRNDGTPAELRAQVDQLHRTYLQLAETKAIP